MVTTACQEAADNKQRTGQHLAVIQLNIHQVAVKCLMMVHTFTAAVFQSSRTRGWDSTGFTVMVLKVTEWELFNRSWAQWVCVHQVDRHLRKLDQELAKFKMELEADNAGITEILERRKTPHPAGSTVLKHESCYFTSCRLLLLRVFRDGQSISASQQPSRPLSHHNWE